MAEVKNHIQSFLIETFSFLPAEVIVMIISATPIIELRGGIPTGAFLGLSFQSAMFFSLLGNLLPIIPILLFFRPISIWMLRFKPYKRFFNWLSTRTINKSDKVEKYGTFGLILFTAVPFPTTGAYSACLAAVLFFIPFRLAFLSIGFGVLIASIIIGIISYPLYR